MFAMTEYPRDILPLYSQGYSLTRFFIQQGGKRKFVEYVGEGMRTNNWTAATRKYYGFNSLSDLQVTWVELGAPRQPGRWQAASRLLASPLPMPRSEPQDEPTAAESFAMARQDSAYGWQAPPAQNARALARRKAWSIRRRRRTLPRRPLPRRPPRREQRLAAGFGRLVCQEA